MNFATLLVLFACLGAANAGSSLRGADMRYLATKKKTAICSMLRAGVYATKYVNQTAAMAPGAFKGACSKICYSLCAEYASFAVSGGKCTCLAGVVATKTPTKASTKAPAKAPTERPTKAPTKPPTKAPTKPPTKAPTSMPTKTPTKAPTKEPTEVNPCNTRPCASNQICSNTAESFTCEPIMCSNPYGNPCGPGRACKDTPTGFTCQSLISSDICIAGCGPNSTCRQGKCECNQGFYRPLPYLGCVAVR
jgi:hypothetical protein